MKNEVDQAELIQSVKALLIPLSLFVSTLISAAGTFLIYNGYALGWAFVALSATLVTGAFVAFVRFQNKLRVKGHFKGDADEPAALSDEAGSNLASPVESPEFETVR